MSNTLTRAERTIELPTTYGPILALFHDDASCYVQFGPQPSVELRDRPPLKLPRGVELHGSAHFKRPISDTTGAPCGTWRPSGRHATAYGSYHRGATDATAKQAETARAAIIEALDAWTATETGASALQLAHRLHGHDLADEYAKTAASLRVAAECCDEYATALEAGARLRYRTVRHSSGFEERVRMVQAIEPVITTDGLTLLDAGGWLPAIREPGRLYGATSYDPHGYGTGEEDNS